jgi:hypothetical protein
MPKKLTIEEMEMLARKNGGKCLSKTYVNSLVKLKWKCDKGHMWKTGGGVIKAGHWCPICGIKKRSRSHKLGIEAMHKIAAEQGGKCLSKEYENCEIKLKWQCKQGHKWEATPNNVKRGTWCPICGIKKRSRSHKLGIEAMRKIAAEQGGRCLSKEYVDASTKLTWQCAQGHKWDSSPDSVKNQESWCPQCGYKKMGKGRQLSIIEMQQIAKERGGKCLSEKYGPMLKWQCRQGHQWEASPHNIKFGTWCPKCTVYREERKCRLIFEKLLNKKMPCSHPKWLRYNGRKLELDGYNSQLKIAFEYQGEQHFKHLKHFGLDRKFKMQQENDKVKIELCEKRDIKLIIIHWKEKDLIKFIHDSLVQFGLINPVHDLEEINFEFEKAYLPQGLDYKKELSKLAKTKGGRLISLNYLGASKNLEWECKHGHKWKATPNSIKSGTWCPHCCRNVRLTLKEMQNIAKERGGKCLSTEYINNATNLRWECSEGHKWKAKPANIKSGGWCPKCGHQMKQN